MSVDKTLITIVGACLLLLPAFYNGYPLVNSDDGTYITSGFLLEVPRDRPVFYGLLLRIFSLNGLSLWIAVAAQALVVSWLLMKIIYLNIEVSSRIVPIIIFILLSCLTSLSWITSEIIPDVCTPIALMALYLLFYEKKLIVKLMLYTIFFLSIATHMSHFIIFSGLILMIIIIKKYFFEKAERKKINIVLVVAFTLVVLSNILNASVYSNSKHVFLMGSLLDKGVLKSYLNEKCGEKSYGICSFKDQMSDDPNWFLWDQNSPLYLQGGWEKTKPEYNQIINDILTTPQCLIAFFREAAKDSWQQMLDFKIGDGNFPFPKESHVYNAIAQHIPNDAEMYNSCWQNKELIVPKLVLFNKIIYFVVVVSGIALLFIIFRCYRKLPKQSLFFVILSLLFIVINNIDCASFAQVNGRYGCRVMWLIPMCLLLVLFNFRNDIKKNA